MTSNQDQYDVKYYDLDLTLNPTTMILSGTVGVTATVLSGPINTFDLQLRSNMTVVSVTSGGVAGTVAPPPEGVRFDIAFEGASVGPKLKGKVTGVDYLRIRADGRFDLHIHAEITTDDGQKISLHADGVAFPQPGSPIVGLRENVTLFTSRRPIHGSTAFKCGPREPLTSRNRWFGSRAIRLSASEVISLPRGRVSGIAYVAP